MRAPHLNYSVDFAQAGPGSLRFGLATGHSFDTLQFQITKGRRRCLHPNLHLACQRKRLLHRLHAQPRRGGFRVTGTLDFQVSLNSTSHAAGNSYDVNFVTDVLEPDTAAIAALGLGALLAAQTRRSQSR